MSSQTEQKISPFTDLARHLMGDHKGILQKQLLEEVDNKISVKEEKLAAGLPAEEKNIAEFELAALKAANRIISLFWHSVHYKAQ